PDPHETKDIDGNIIIKVTAVMVAGRPGTVAVSTPENEDVELVWQRKPGQWVTIDGPPTGGDPAQLVRVGAGLRDRQQTGEATFTLARAPARFVLAESGARGFVLQPPPRLGVPVGGGEVVVGQCKKALTTTTITKATAAVSPSERNPAGCLWSTGTST
ncbi:MAG: hypothetical protein H0U53_06710, partial [Actinobacteria bacterium]|nr:hypothetical protein [Actinomycetota bacterium]